MAEQIRFSAALNKALHVLMAEDPRVVLLGEDIIDPYGGAFKITKGLSTAFPDRVFPTPIAEGAIAGIGAGLAMKGFLPIVEIMFGDFTSLAFDQIVNGISKFQSMYNNKVTCPLVIRTPMGGGRGYGPTHSQSLEKFLVGIPHLMVLTPSLFCDVEAFYRAAIQEAKPSFIVENKLMYGEFLKTVHDGRCGDFYIQSPTTPFAPAVLSLDSFTRADATLITYGGMTSIALRAAEKLYLEEELVLEVLVLHSLSGSDPSSFQDSIARSRRALVLEEGTKTLGIGAEISAMLHEHFFAGLAAPIMRIASPDDCIPSAKRLETAYLPDEKKVYDAVLQLTKR